MSTNVYATATQETSIFIFLPQSGQLNLNRPHKIYHFYDFRVKIIFNGVFKFIISHNLVNQKS